MRYQTQRGFTFPEIIVLLVILAVLLIILFPLFTPRRSGGDHNNTCYNNQRQLAVGILGYAQDNDEQLPLPTANEWVAATNLMNDPKVFDCYQTKKQGTPANPEYGYNAHLVDMSTGTPQPLAASQIDDPTLVEVTADLAEMLPAGVNTITTMTLEGSTRHKGGALVSYLDGHVAYAQPTWLVHGLAPYSIPNVSYADCNFSAITTADKANAAIQQGWCGSTSAMPPGKFNPKKKTWDLPAGATLVSMLPPTPYGMTINLECTCKPGVTVSICEPSCRSSDGNLLQFNEAAGGIHFGCDVPANPGGQQLAAKYRGNTGASGVSFKHATHLRLTVTTGYTPDVAATGKDGHVALNNNGSPYLFNPRDNDSYMLLTPLHAQVAALPSTKTQLKYEGNYLVWHRATDSPRAISAVNGPISIQRLYVSH